jgi:hypothetical protein
MFIEGSDHDACRKKAVLLFGNSNITTWLICLYHNDSQPGVRIPPGVRTRILGGTQKKLNNGGKIHICLLSLECVCVNIHYWAIYLQLQHTNLN